MKLRCLLLLVVGILSFNLNSIAQTIIINEVSQGASGNREYVELLVVGDPFCGNEVPCMDLRGYILDDNNGRFKSGSGSGIAAGYMRFKNIPFWQCVPQGTLIVIYNAQDRNTNIPADDVSLTDGNCRLIIPSTSTLFEYSSTLPTANNQAYNPNNVTFNSPMTAAQWTSVMGMRGAGDSFQIRTPDATTIVHAVSWGDNNANTIIYFAGDAGAKVFSFTNNTSNAANVQANWSQGVAAATGGSETPGFPNNAANEAFIASINPNCGNAPAVNIEITGNTQNTGCGQACTGSIQLNVTGGTAPYTYNWSNGATTQNLTGLCAGTYTVEVLDNSGCSNTEQFTITASGNLTLTPTLQHETCNDACNGSVSIVPAGGTAPYTYSWNTGATTATINNLCDGIYTVTVTDNAGCVGTLAQVINPGTSAPQATISGPLNVTTNATAVTYSANQPVISWSASCQTCISSNGVFNPSAAGPGTYEICVVTGTQDCNTTSCINVVVTAPEVECTPDHINIPVTLCPGESYTHDNNTFTTPGTHTLNYLNQGGCDSILTIQLNFHSVPTAPILHDLCIGDSIEINGQVFYDNFTFAVQMTTQQGCAYVQTYEIKLVDCDKPDLEVFIPNVFTPNGDDINDKFEISIKDGILVEGYIFNRWGEIVNTFAKGETTWDGTTRRGDQCPDGVYTYLIKVEAKGEVNHQYHGFVTIVR